MPYAIARRCIPTMKINVIVNGVNYLAGFAVQRHRSWPQHRAPWLSVPSGAIPPGACPELRRRGQYDMGFRRATLHPGSRRHPARYLPEHALSFVEGVSMTQRFRCRTMCHGSRCHPARCRPPVSMTQRFHCGTLQTTNSPKDCNDPAGRRSDLALSRPSPLIQWFFASMHLTLAQSTTATSARRRGH